MPQGGEEQLACPNPRLLDAELQLDLALTPLNPTPKTLLRQRFETGPDRDGSALHPAPSRYTNKHC